ncbi:hypothetical protein [Adhaeribacter pallidiroseus]|uniref:Uncharacterized protein n=1 Tax=Adhaeribacter pallidiroseus TaxID=2072847 RepID=A0A369QRQ0_9BACT|nr:hypothetical protein [Adhaeribacter pallidiroseus]RDC65917.1 hypothetical protein AHMF7616_04548 [Adhaeribacter pallidiroseus]
MPYKRSPLFCVELAQRSTQFRKANFLIGINQQKFKKTCNKLHGHTALTIPQAFTL